MRALLVGLVMAMVTVTVTRATDAIYDVPICPTFDPNGEVVLLPNVDDCTAFYICDGDNIAILDHCDDGLWFNPDVSVCDYPENVSEGVCKPPANRPILL